MKPGTSNRPGKLSWRKNFFKLPNLSAATTPPPKRINQRRLADEDERHEHQQVFQADEQRGVIPDFAPREKNGGEYEQPFVKLHRGKIEQ
jgi:hypothetical protein